MQVTLSENLMGKWRPIPGSLYAEVQVTAWGVTYSTRQEHIVDGFERGQKKDNSEKTRAAF